ncbi:transcriptional regulator, TetR family [Saccharopolyspora kobensis]|uniref:Transcriptional regulator, TetR family n=1 Tax=Saccharopolyspora kobensis TaxID=146035 RepID=A0A1H6EAE3_9PSEU|nr:TetR/AcrR family transcriptional regulator [Saccharopolyspora kobensis]SEG94672.1 transcriptional regulator, TetR family [Saccharopolyspora kobensis]SFD63607.1 transcriptional regulator, TetR family [Saccharopolyspora kobensis]
MARPRAHDDALRTRLLDRAGELLSAQGPEGLGLRRLAADVGTSTTAVYSLFGGKPGLVRELYAEGFQRLGDRMAQVPRTDDPVADMCALGLAYRESALANPHFYSIMFGRAVPDFVPDEESVQTALRSIRPLEDAVARGIEQGLLADTDPGEITFAAWALVHGLVSLELNSPLARDDTSARYERALVNGIAGWRR